MKKTQFAGHVIAFKSKNDDEANDEATLIEVTQCTQDGYVELGFNDRDERCFLKFKLSDMMASLCLECGAKAE